MHAVAENYIQTDTHTRGTATVTIIKRCSSIGIIQRTVYTYVCTTAQHEAHALIRNNWESLVKQYWASERNSIIRCATINSDFFKIIISKYINYTIARGTPSSNGNAVLTLALTVAVAVLLAVAVTGY